MTGRSLRKSSGFTLVEILLALSLMSMLLALAYGGLRAATRATDKGQTILEDSGTIRAAHQFVRKQLNQMVPLAIDESEDNTERSVFIGQPGSIRFVAPMPGFLGFGGLQVQELSIQRGRDGQELILNHTPLEGFNEQKLYDSQAILLVEKIESGGFRFLGRDETGELTPWIDTWTDPAVLPVAVSLELNFVEEVYIQWPLLTASVRVDSSALQELAGDLSVNQSYRSAIQNMINNRKGDQ